MEFNLEKIKSKISHYNDYLKKLEENINEINSAFEDLKNYWHDGRSIELFNSIQLEKNRVNNLHDNIKSQKEIYEVIKERYSKIGDKIKCNLYSKSVNIYKLSIICTTLDRIVDRYNSINYLNEYDRSYMIINQKEKFTEILNDFEDIKNNILEKYKEIEEIEKEITEFVLNVKLEILSLNKYEMEE